MEQIRTMIMVSFILLILKYDKLISMIVSKSSQSQIIKTIKLCMLAHK